MKKLFKIAVVLVMIGLLLNVPITTLTNGNFRSGEIAALKYRFGSQDSITQLLTPSATCELLAIKDGGFSSLGDVTGGAVRDWVEGCKFVLHKFG